MESLNWVDYVLLGIIFFSILMGLSRGGVKEIVSLITWVAAIIVAVLFAKPLAAYFTGSHSVQSVTATATGSLGVNAGQSISWLAIGASFCALFIVTLIVGAIIGYVMSRAVELGGVSIANRLLGGMFGLGRGCLIDLVIVFLVQLTALSHQAFWSQSMTVNAFQPAVTWLANEIQPGFETFKAKMGDAINTIDSNVKESVSKFSQ